MGDSQSNGVSNSNLGFKFPAEGIRKKRKTVAVKEALTKAFPSLTKQLDLKKFEPVLGAKKRLNFEMTSCLRSSVGPSTAKKSKPSEKKLSQDDLTTV